MLAIPLLSMQTGHVGDGADPASYTDKQAYDMITEGFGPGYNGPFTIVVNVGHGASGDTSLASHLQSDLASTRPAAAHGPAVHPLPANPAGFWVSCTGGQTVRRPWYLSCCQGLDRDRCDVTPVR